MKIKGYTVPFGYCGLVDGHYILFATENEYYEYMEEREIMLAERIARFKNGEV